MRGLPRSSSLAVAKFSGAKRSASLADIPPMNAGLPWTIASDRVPRKPQAGCAVLPAFQVEENGQIGEPGAVRPSQSLRRGGSWSWSVDQPQSLLEQFLRHRDLGHLDYDVAAMAH